MVQVLYRKKLDLALAAGLLTPSLPPATHPTRRQPFRKSSRTNKHRNNVHSGLGSRSQSRSWSSVGTPPTKPTGRHTIFTCHITAPTRRRGDAPPTAPSRSGGNGGRCC
ncbi:hypothetical protein PCASD_21254 [Puccinia coronata f. sp. avenae]|uniref:Uncharacterized protein n=1 Tax=Puccinia coronata f. sp. avenae TaxID=200324 RepID=A0A2N5U2E8_9BASI|nr:hypothetical protein PCASD_21254 [Puccinia coronata f. sp. avenae]